MGDIYTFNFIVCCVDRLRVSSGRFAGARKCVSRNTQHFSSGVTALFLYRFAIGSLGYFQAPVEEEEVIYIC